MTTSLLHRGRSQVVRIPHELRLEGQDVHIRRLGDGLLLVPVKAAAWPEGFFERICIDDEGFTRPDQGESQELVDVAG